MKPRILVIDDDRMMRFNIADYLENNGDTVCEAGDVADAIVAERKRPPDLVHCDLRSGRSCRSASCASGPMT